MVENMKNELLIRRMEPNDIPLISEAFRKIDWNKPESQYLQYYNEQIAEKRIVFLAFINEEFAGYGNIVWTSRYPLFREKQIPEISDLNVLPLFRRRGIASAIMDKAEEIAFKRSDVVGIGVGLYADYGPAQTMYVLRGYVPDGRGITYNYAPVYGGRQVCADDDLIMWFTKTI